ncbi:ester cyclase [Janthinobacterium sp. GB4P2]|uniref:ester cyclase n=1 Tax=Janthinobacterium sp. GB4P2 TaxID=3424189 RepID=UPI003F20A8CD
MSRVLAKPRSDPLQASQVCHAAVPDLKVAIEEMLVAGNRVSLRLHFTGHFTGGLPTPQAVVQGQGQAIDFHAFDWYQVKAQGRISDNWHLEDKLTLLRQPGGELLQQEVDQQGDARWLEAAAPVQQVQGSASGKVIV